jgi:hypothetical protein
MIEEAAAVWADGGVTFEWHRAERDHPPAAILVLVGSIQRAPPTRPAPLGWLETGSHSPTYIHVSYVNVLEMLRSVGEPNAMSLSVRDTYVGRRLGRVLAHELGHYLLGSTRHARRGLMCAILTPDALFDVSRAALEAPASICDANAYK